ncbi:MAG: dTMP kinase [Clostridiaceae bacterium]|nr:dTMP kinase [Clostridiaceae bacterium]
MRAGKFITFEGIDGSGKTTQIRYLADYLESRGFEIVLLREPGGTEIGEEIRRILLDMRNQGMTMEAELFLFEAARAQLVRTVIRPTLERGIWVISDRFHDSSVAYQGYGRGLPVDMVQSLNKWAIGETQPDLTIVLELSMEARNMRLERRQDSGHKDRFDVESQAFKQRVCSGFRAIAQEEPDRVIVIESQDGKEETAKLIREQVRRNLL